MSRVILTRGIRAFRGVVPMHGLEYRRKSREELELEVLSLRRQLADAALWRASLSSEEHLRTREDLHRSEAMLKSLARAVPVGVGIARDRILEWTNDRISEITGYSAQELQGRSARILYPSDEEFQRVAAIKHPQVRSSGCGSVETQWKRKDGELLDIFLSSAAMDPDDFSAGLVFTALDISEKKLAERALRDSEESYRSLVDNAVYGIYRSNPEGRFIDVNPALVRILGYSSPEELLACDLARDVYADPADRRRLAMEASEQELRSGVEVEWKRSDGSRIMVRLTGRPVYGRPGEVKFWEVIAEDISERRMLEQQLGRSQRLEAVGQLAGGIAHDFNNLLTAIGGYSEILIRQLSEDDPRRSKVVEIMKAGQRAANLTRQLLAFSRRQVLQPQILDLNSAVSGLEPMLRRLIGENIELSVQFDPDLGQVKADEAQIEQVIMNLVVNARDAMKAGGRLTVETRNLTANSALTHEHFELAAGRYVSLTVRDSGCGMSECVLDRMFEPFFTTKSRDHGTGLGLATVYGIVRQSGGHILVESEPGLGTEIRVLLPRVDEVAKDGIPENGLRRAPTGQETVLLVEDEEAVRVMTREILESCGYRVFAASTSEEALEIWAERGDAVDLLLTDVVMPGTSGPELADALNRFRPELPTVFMSGYTEPVIRQHGTLGSDAAFLPKPFTPVGLLECVREVLDRV